jgi:hypothetical protein
MANGPEIIAFCPVLREPTSILTGNNYRLSNPGTADIVIIETRVGSYVGEDDIIRFDDIYGRT